MNLLLARGRDRLETPAHNTTTSSDSNLVSYSLGDAIDWKQTQINQPDDALTILLLARGRDRLETQAIQCSNRLEKSCLLLARGRDRLETINFSSSWAL